MSALITALADAGIQLRSDTPGSHRVRCPRCDRGPRDDTLGVTIDDDGSAFWHCFRCEWKDSWRELGSKSDPSKRPANVAHAHHSKAKRVSHPKRSIHEEIASRKLRPVTPDSLAGRYFASRNNPLPPNDVFYTPAEFHPQEQRCYPCIVAIVTNIITAKLQSLHFTFLDPDGCGKASIERPRLYLAGHRKAGGVVRLHADDEVTQGLIVGEGLETCLTYALEFSPVWACLDAGNLAAFPVLPGLQGLTVLVDNDDAGRKAFEEVRERYEAAGIEVIGIRAKGKPGADINDVVAA